MTNTKKQPKLVLLVLILMALAGFSTLASSANNPFAQADVTTVEKMQKNNENKCGEGRCGSSQEETTEAKKCGEGKCGNKTESSDDNAETTETKCGEGKCGDKKEKKPAKKKCGEGKCG